MESVMLSSRMMDYGFPTVSSSKLRTFMLPRNSINSTFLRGQQLHCFIKPAGRTKSRLVVESVGRTPSEPLPDEPEKNYSSSTPLQHKHTPTESSSIDTTGPPLVGRTPTEPLPDEPEKSNSSTPLEHKHTPTESSTTHTTETPRPTPEKVQPAPLNRVKIGIYFVTWWGLNVVFNIYNKKVLNAYPYPWLTSTLSLLAGSTLMFISWATGLVAPPDTDLEFWKSLFPVALAHTIGHVAATVSMSKVAVSFTHIIKSSEPAFSVIIQRLLLGEHFSLPVYLSLVPIIGGCGLAALTELNFNMTGFMGAMISNIAFVFRNIFSKKGMKAGKAVGGLNYYACLSIMSLALLTPFALVVERPQQWISGWGTAVQSVGPQLFWWVVAQSVFYHLYNQVSYMSLDEISPLTFSIGNTMKRVTVIVSSILIFRTPVQPINAFGAAIAILGTFFYSQAKQ